MGLNDIMPRHCNQVRPEELESGGVVTVTDPVSIHLKYLDRGQVLVLKQMFDLQVGAEGGPLGKEVDGPAVGDVAAAYGCLCSTEIIDEKTLVGGWQLVQEPG